MIEIFEDEAGGWRYRVKGGNGEILCTSESYTRKGDAIIGYNTLHRHLWTRPPIRVVEP